MIWAIVITVLILAIPTLVLVLSELVGLLGFIPVFVGVCVLLLFVVLPPQIALCTVLLTGGAVWVVRRLMRECAEYTGGSAS